ncbi:MAG: hypothetical protein V7K97_13095 [Nostoc sp.]|uniref:hypothetical protein n=1 Tax=Nostoc sp. TaxID=1180 RepID=UPI002FFA8548
MDAITSIDLAITSIDLATAIVILAITFIDLAIKDVPEQVSICGRMSGKLSRI